MQPAALATQATCCATLRAGLCNCSFALLKCLLPLTAQAWGDAEMSTTLLPMGVAQADSQESGISSDDQFQLPEVGAAQVRLPVFFNILLMLLLLLLCLSAVEGGVYLPASALLIPHS